MGNDNSKNIRLGIFVLVGTIFLIVAMYFIGAKQSLFSSTIKVSAVFHTVDGLMPGNNVRFAGIDVGTVEKVEIQSDLQTNVSTSEGEAEEFINQQCEEVEVDRKSVV